MAEYCTTHEGSILPCQICAAVERNKKLREDVARVRAGMPAGMLDGPGAPPPVEDASPIVGKEVSYIHQPATAPPSSPVEGWAAYPEHHVATLPNAPADPIVTRAQDYVDAQRQEKEIADRLEQTKANVAAYTVQLEQAQRRTAEAKQKLAAAMEKA